MPRTTAAPLCAHDRPLASCRNEYTPQQRDDFDAAHNAAYTYAIEVFRERDDAERFAAAVAEVAARSGLGYVDLRRDLGQWIREGRVT